MIDLTLSDSEHVDEDEDGNNVNDRPIPLHQTKPTVLLSPLSTVLKSDRLGIGLKAKTEGPYRSSVKHVTPTAAALAAPAKVSEDLRRTHRPVRKGSSGVYTSRTPREGLPAAFNGLPERTLSSRMLLAKHNRTFSFPPKAVSDFHIFRRLL